MLRKCRCIATDTLPGVRAGLLYDQAIDSDLLQCCTSDQDLYQWYWL